MDTIGTGTYGTVQIIDKIVRKKVLKKYYHIFLREVALLKYLNINDQGKKYVPTILEVNPIDISFDMPKYDIDLFTFIRQKNSISNRAKTIPLLIEALYYLHTNHVLHGDLKPSNIMVGDHYVIIIDYGLSGTLDFNHADFCTPAYRDPVTPKNFSSDIYSLGIILIELIVGDCIINREVREMVSVVQEPLKSVLKSMISSKQKNRPTIVDIADHFKIIPPSILSIPSMELYEGEVSDQAIDWIQEVVQGYFANECISPQSVAIYAHTITQANSFMFQYYIVAIVAVLASLRGAEVSLTMILNLCPLRDNTINRKNRLQEAIRNVLNHPTVLYYMVTTQ